MLENFDHLVEAVDLQRSYASYRDEWKDFSLMYPWEAV